MKGKGIAALAAAAMVAACGGRAAQPVAPVATIDAALSCAHIEAELRANAARADDLRGERNTNRLRSLSRVPGALIGNPISAIALADPSIAIYRELGALQLRNTRLGALALERGCGAAAPAGPRSVSFGPDGAVASGGPVRAPARGTQAAAPGQEPPPPSQSLEAYASVGDVGPQLTEAPPVALTPGEAPDGDVPASGEAL